jgi:hypothetical protein
MKKFYSGFGNPNHSALIAAAGMTTTSHYDHDAFYERSLGITGMLGMPALPTAPEIKGLDGSDAM